jgi:hypothetical protein
MQKWNSGKHHICICITNKVYWSPSNKSQTLTRYSIWQQSHMTYRPLPLAVVLRPSYRTHARTHTHTALGKSTSNSSLVILSSSLYFLDNISYNLTPIFILQFKNYAAQHRLSTRQTSVNHYEFQSSTALYSVMMDRIRSETCRSDL